MKRWPLPVLATLCVALTGCDQAQGNPVAESGDFCQDARGRVDAFFSGLEQPIGDRFGGTVVAGSPAELADGMNSLVSVDYGANQHQVFVNLMTLIRLDDALEPVGYLAESWELADDGSSLTFRLRPDVIWHDGVPTTAEDVAFTYKRATDPATGFPNASAWSRYVSGPEGVEVLDDLTVRIRLEPHADWMAPWRNVAILPAHLLDDVPAEELRQHPFGTRCPVGNGPFRFVEHRDGDRWVFARNPSFPESLGGPPHLDRYVYRVIPDQTTLVTELLTGGVDVYVGARTEQAERIESSAEARLVSYPFRSFLFVVWNSRRPQLAQPEVRRAITTALDREEMLQVLGGGYGLVANASVPPFHKGYDPTMEAALPHDPDQARRMLAEAGWVDRDGDGVRERADGLPLSITLNANTESRQRVEVAEVIQAQLAEVGIQVHIQVQEWATHLGELTDPEARDYDGAVMAWLTDFEVDDTDLLHSARVDGPLGWSGTNNPEIDRLLETLPSVLDPDESRTMWAEYQRAIVAEQPFTFLFFPDRLDGVSRRLRDVRMDARGEWATVTRWWIPESDRRRRAAADG
jgi:peptide/nickel transport system substrate-binding protein